MRTSLLAVLCLLAALTTQSVGVNAYHKAPEFVLNLDLPPEQRWVGAIDTVLAHHSYNASIGAVLDYYLAGLGGLPSSAFELLENVTRDWHPEMYAEAKGIIQKLVTVGAPPSYATRYWGLLYGYELSHAGMGSLSKLYSKACTGILSLPQDNLTAPMLHGRNMDKLPRKARNCTLHILAQRNGTTVWEAFDWVWLATGLATSARRGGVTMEFNWRQAKSTATDIIALLLAGATPLMRAMRNVFDRDFGFDQALSYYNRTQFAGPFYIIMSGTNRRGAVMALDWDPKDNVVDILDDSSSQSFMIQTNWDRWEPDPPMDPRRTIAHEALMMQDQEMRGTKLGLWMALSVYPVHNPNTLFTALMHTGDGRPGHLIHGFTRREMVPTNTTTWQDGPQ